MNRKFYKKLLALTHSWYDRVVQKELEYLYFDRMYRNLGVVQLKPSLIRVGCWYDNDPSKPYEIVIYSMDDVDYENPLVTTLGYARANYHFDEAELSSSYLINATPKESYELRRYDGYLNRELGLTYGDWILMDDYRRFSVVKAEDILKIRYE